MSGMWGNKLKISIFGESHGDAIGITIDGLPSGVALDLQKIKTEMIRRAPNGEVYSTMRKEDDDVQIVSGFFNGKTTGTPLCGLILNENTQSKDYSKTKNIMRPSHSDYGYFVKSNGNNDYRGGGHSSGRITAPLVFCGAICKQLLAEKGIEIVSHILSIADIKDKRFDDKIDADTIKHLSGKTFPLLETIRESDMIQRIVDAKYVGDSVGGTIECAIVGVKPGIGDPFFDSIESKLSSLLFSVPAVKAVEFGNGYEIAKMRASVANDTFSFEKGKVITNSNNNGGVLGGISTGMPIVFNVAIKPTASIFLAQQSINVETHENVRFNIEGRHDPCIVIRALPVIEAVSAIAIYDLVCGQND